MEKRVAEGSRKVVALRPGKNNHSLIRDLKRSYGR
jgi:hypothetical protein